MLEISLIQNPPVSFNFLVTFLAGELVEPNLLDFRFQKVSGITSTIETSEIREGGENLFIHRLPERVMYENLVLERGMIIGSLLNQEFNDAMSSMKIFPRNVLVMLLNNFSLPISSWLFENAYPVKWSVSDLDANSNSIVVDTMELTYSRIKSLRV